MHIIFHTLFSGKSMWVSEGKIWPLWLQALREIDLEDKVHYEIALLCYRIAALI